MSCSPFSSAASLWLTALVAWQEYLPRIKDNDVLRAVEKNSSGSRPKELFEEVLEEVDKQWEADRWVMALVLVLHCFCSSLGQLASAVPCKTCTFSEHISE